MCKFSIEKPKKCEKFKTLCTFADIYGSCTASRCIFDEKDSNTVYVTCDVANVSYGTACIICGESVELTENEVILLKHGLSIHSKVCEKCKRAILYVRNQLENGEI